jgi:integrase/recombinase XerD
MKNKRPKEWLTKDEYNKLINNPYLPRKDDLMLSLLYSCALRVSELIEIRVRDIDIKNATITIQESKRSDGPALVPVPGPLLKRINQWISDHNLTKTRYLIFSNHSNQMSRTQVHRIVKKAAEATNIDKELTTHTFRRTRAKHLLDNGLPLEQVSKLLRHKYLESTMHYLQISINDLQKAITKIDENNTS